MKKMKLGVALLLSVLLVDTPVGTVRADEATGTADVNEQIEVQESEAQENETPENEMQEEVLTSLYLTDEDQSGTNWTYTAADHMLKITGDVTVKGTAEKTIQATGSLHITVASGAKLSVISESATNKRWAIYADDDIVLDGGGTINIKHGSETRAIYAGKGVKIDGITLNIPTESAYQNYQEIWAEGGELVINDAVVTVQGNCMAGKKDAYQSVHILGNSVVAIRYTINTDNAGGLRGAEFEFSKDAHVIVQATKGPLIGADSRSDFKLAAGQTEDCYFRSTTEGTSFTKGKIAITSDYYFEYIGANHVDKTKITSYANADAEQWTHTMQCGCERKTSITENCSGGTATCTTQATCKVCGQRYGNTIPHTYDDYHVCSVCGGLETGADVVVAVVAGGEKRGYTSGEMKTAIDFAGEHPGAVLTIIDPARSCLDGLQVNNPEADFTIELDGVDNGYYGSVTVSSGKVTIRDSKTGGTFHMITTEGTGTVTLESGKITGGVDVTNGTFNVNGGTISYINLTDGQLNWNSSTATVGKIYWTRKCDKKMNMNDVPGAPLHIILPVEWNLSKPVAVAGNGISLKEDMFTIDMEANNIKKYTLKPVAQGNQIYARLPLTQLRTDDIVLKQPTSGFTYDGKAKKPSVTVQRVTSQNSYDHSESTSALVLETDYTVTYKDNVHAGTATVTITGIGCYTDSVERTFTINKAVPEQSEVNADGRTYSCRVDNADRVDLTAYLPKDHGAIIAAATTADGDLTYSSAPAVAGGVLSYTIKSSEAAGGMINVTVSTTNYEDITIRIPVETKDIGILKLMDGSFVTLQNATLTEGEKLSTLKFNDAVFVDEEGNEVPGTLVFRTPDAAPAVGTVDAEWVFQPDNGKTYMEISGMVSIMVKAKATSGGGSSSGGSSSGGASSGGGGAGGGGAAVTDPKDDTKKDDTKKDDTKKDDTKKDNTKKDDTKKDNTKKDDSKKDNTKKDDTKTDDTKKDSTKQDTAIPEPAGTKLKDSSGVSYEVTSDSKKTPTVTYTEAPKKAKETVTIPKTVTVDGTKYKVTSIEENAFAENKNVKQIVVSQNITTIGANAFADCSKLKTITINSVKLTGKNVADDAFADIADGTVIRVPQKMLDRYQRLFEKKGLSKKVKVVAIKNRKNK